VSFRLRCMATQLDGLGGLWSTYVFESWPLRRELPTSLHDHLAERAR